MNKADFLLELGKAISVNGRVNADRYAKVVELVENYIQHQLQQCNVSGSLPPTDAELFAAAKEHEKADRIYTSGIRYRNFCNGAYWMKYRMLGGNDR